MAMRTLGQSLQREATRPRFTQNGVHFQTICAECNNELLGREYDPALNQLCRDTSQLMLSCLALPLLVSVRASVLRVKKAVAGHLLAALVQREDADTDNAPMFKAMREFVISPGEGTHEGLEFFYWPYMQDHHVLIQGAALGSIHAPPSSVLLGSFLKFFPLAFWVVWQRPATATIPFTKLGKAALDEIVEIPVTHVNNPPQDWPERPGGPEWLQFDTNESVVATRR